MKKTISLLILFTTLGVKSQNIEVEKSITGTQIGLFGLNIYNESKLFENTSLRTEMSLNPIIWGGTMYPNTGFAFFPSISLQPKYYYNLKKRNEKGKNTAHNSGNYIGLQLGYTPDWFTISNYDHFTMYNQVHLVPTFGIRRSFTKSFNYEFKVGLGYGSTFGYENNQSGAVIDLGMKIGYDFFVSKN